MPELGVLTLQGAIQHYDWGGHDFIPNLLGIANSQGRPFAELWMGAHPKAPATADVAGAAIPLNRLIAGAPQEILGASASSHFGGSLPYLFKVLDVASMLSIQAHPTKEQAVDGFARENAAGISLESAQRNYKDQNHKPEVCVALTEFWMLHGFRPMDEIATVLRGVPELHSIMPDFPERLLRAGDAAQPRRDLLRDLYRTLMTMPEEHAEIQIDALVARLAAAPQPSKDNPDYWVARALATFPAGRGHCDRGIFLVYLLNLVRLRPGQGTFQPAGTLHAYLEGVTVELMANSDNVLRGGLTSKHVNVPELISILTFENGPPRVLAGESACGSERVYRTPSAEFELSCIDLPRGGEYAGQAARGPDSIIALKGASTLTAGDQNIPLARGSIVLAPFGTRYAIQAGVAPAMFFKASVPNC